MNARIVVGSVIAAAVCAAAGAAVQYQLTPTPEPVTVVERVTEVVTVEVPPTPRVDTVYSVAIPASDFRHEAGDSPVSLLIDTDHDGNADMTVPAAQLGDFPDSFIHRIIIEGE